MAVEDKQLMGSCHVASGVYRLAEQVGTGGEVNCHRSNMWLMSE